ncbi:outer membrane protein [Ancylobacter amanitiformis]|uniref:Outer membrane immunogenic protein n=1 Tax=Ancylobacter amanitiformis TaxID=217069 RepID=A0ABU0LLG4_9HYPH|nr:outer membrane protein [Ancylobacter amanitiformis]MDQ0509507.1 outer membrane immunogenic protein [Ancylobacter amanitiformis]
MSIKAILLGSAAVVALAVPSFAADLAYPVKAAPMVYAPPVFTWTGFYLGGNFGYGWGESSAPWRDYLNYKYLGWDQNSYGGAADPEGWFGGFQFGYNYQFANNVVLGAEADFQFGSITGNLDYFGVRTSPGNFDQQFGSIETEIESFGTVRARMGYAMDRFLPYVTGGLAWGNVKVSEGWNSYLNGNLQPLLGGSNSASETLWGWTLGGGIEYAVTDNWTVKGEYLYTDLGDISWNGSTNTRADVSLQTLKMGVNYKF